jgi:hypothetical protein
VRESTDLFQAYTGSFQTSAGSFQAYAGSLRALHSVREIYGFLPGLYGFLPCLLRVYALPCKNPRVSFRLLRGSRGVLCEAALFLYSYAGMRAAFGAYCVLLSIYWAHGCVEDLW